MSGAGSNCISLLLFLTRISINVNSARWTDRRAYAIIILNQLMDKSPEKQCNVKK